MTGSCPSGSAEGGPIAGPSDEGKSERRGNIGKLQDQELPKERIQLYLAAFEAVTGHGVLV